MRRFSTFRFVSMALVIGCIVACNALPAQVTINSGPVSVWHRNSISIFHREFNCFDRNGMVVLPHIRRLYPNALGFGAEFSHQWTSKSGFLVSLGVMGRWYSPPSGARPSGLPGIVVERQMLNADLAYLRLLRLKPWLNLRGSAGISFRYGREWVDYWYWGGSDFYMYQGYRLADFGATVGGGMEFLLPWRLRIGLDGRFTEYLLRTDRSRLPLYSNYAGKGATRHMFILQMSLGYRFSPSSSARPL